MLNPEKELMGASTALLVLSVLATEPSYGYQIVSEMAHTRHLACSAGTLYPLLRRLLPRYWTTTENMGRAMIRAASEGCPKRILYSEDINALAVMAPA